MGNIIYSRQQIVTGSGGSSGREVLTANKTVWAKSNFTYAEVAQTGGDDTTGDGTELNPWLTIDKLSNYIATVDLNGFTLTCKLNGSFGTEGLAFTWKMPIGSGSLIITDSVGNKNNTKLKGSFRFQSANIPITFEQVTLQESISNGGQLKCERGVSCILKNCRARSGYYVLWVDGGRLKIQNELIFRNYRTAGTTTLECLFYGLWNGQIDVAGATIKTVVDDSDTVGGLTFTSSLCNLETHSLYHAGGATFTGTANSVRTTDWHKYTRNPNWTYS